MEHIPEQCFSCPERGRDIHTVCAICDRAWPCPRAVADCDRACVDCLRCYCICVGDDDD